MNIQAMVDALEHTEQAVREAQAERRRVRADIIKEIVRNEAYEFITLNISNMRRYTQRTDRRK